MPFSRHSQAPWISCRMSLPNKRPAHPMQRPRTPWRHTCASPPSTATCAQPRHHAEPLGTLHSRACYLVRGTTPQASAPSAPLRVNHPRQAGGPGAAPAGAGAEGCCSTAARTLLERTRDAGHQQCAAAAPVHGQGEFPADPAPLVLRKLQCPLLSWTNHKPRLWVLHDQTLRVNRACFKPHRGVRNSDSAAGGSRGRSLGWRGAHSHACR